MSRTRRRAVGALALAILAASTSAILVRFSEAPSSVAALHRVVLTVAIVAPIALARPADRTAFARFSGRDFGWAAIAGIALAIHFATWFESLEHTSVAASVTLVQTQPVFVAIGGALVLGERVDRITVVGIVVAVLGAAAMGFGDGGQAATTGTTWYGNALALTGSITVAGYVLAGRSIRQRVPLFPYVSVVYTACALTLLAVVLAQGHDLLAYPPREWALFLALAIGPGILGHTIINWVLGRLESVVVSVAWLGEPLGATLLALGLLGEVPDAITVVGGVVVLAGIAVIATNRDQ